MWIHKSSTIGKIVKIITSKEVLKGKALGIDEDGALILEAENKIIKKIYSGDCIHLRNID
jgi:BirA family biotin operon repressor/biotin-[acetyl-CoA-carboxylase] ligase